MTFTLDLTPLRRALTSLEDSLRVTEDVAWLQAQSDAVRNTLFAGVIQNFEFVYELAAQGADATEVTLTYDWSKVTDKGILKTLSFPVLSAEQLESSLARLAEAVAS